MASVDINQEIAAYTVTMRIPAPKVLVLTEQLVHGAPEDMTPAQKRRLKKVKTAAKAVERVQTARERGSPAKVQGPRLAFANAFTALHSFLVSYARLPVTVISDAGMAEAIASSLFPDGVAFTKLEAVDSYAHGTRLLHRIEDEKLEETIESLGGAPYLAAVRAAARSLGDALGVHAKAPPKPSSRALVEALVEYQSAVIAYARSLAADVDVDDEASVKRFFEAVAPIDELRSRPGGTEVEEEPEVEDSTDVTPVVEPVMPEPVSPEPTPA